MHEGTILRYSDAVAGSMIKDQMDKDTTLVKYSHGNI